MGACDPFKPRCGCLQIILLNSNKIIHGRDVPACKFANSQPRPRPLRPSDGRWQSRHHRRPRINPQNMLPIDIIDAYKPNSLLQTETESGMTDKRRSGQIPIKRINRRQRHQEGKHWLTDCLAMTRICLSDLEDNAGKRDRCIHTHAPFFARLVCTLLNRILWCTYYARPSSISGGLVGRGRPRPFWAMAIHVTRNFNYVFVN